MGLQRVGHDLATKQHQHLMGQHLDFLLCLVTKSCPTLCDPMDCSIQGSSVLHHLLELAQTPCPLSQWSHPTISSSVTPFSSFPQSFPASGSLSLCYPGDSQESSSAPQFQSISSSALSLLYGPALTSAHDFWKNHSFDHTDLCWQSDVSAF